jgi:hypothetical protein
MGERKFMNRIKAISRGVRAALKKQEPQQFEVADKKVTCSHCGGKDFKRHNLFRSFDSPKILRGSGLECATCHHLELFATQPQELNDAT